MRAVVASEPGGPEVLSIDEVEDPTPGPGEVLVEVVAAGLNRADLLQRQGHYPPPPGASDIIGMECSGRVLELGEAVSGGASKGTWAVGDEVCALLAGGGYAERVVVPVGQLMPVPAGIDLVSAAALPEVACTVWSNVFMVAGLRPEETVLVHGGAGGIGSFAIQLASQLGSTVFTTAGTAEKRAACQALGADLAIDYHESDFVAVVKDHTDGAGVDVVLDNMGAKYLTRNVDVLADQGRLVIIGMQGGSKAELDISALLRKRASVTATALRSRTVENKALICSAVVRNVWPLVADGRVRPIVDTVLALDQAAQAHELMTSGSHSGKILLTTAP